MRQIVAATIVTLILLAGTLLAVIGIKARTGSVPPEKLIPADANITIRFFNLRENWDELAESKIVDALLYSDVFEKMDQADELEFQIYSKLAALDTETDYVVKRTPSPVLALRDELRRQNKIAQKYKFNYLNKYHLLDLIGQDVLIAIQLKAGKKQDNILLISAIGGRGFAAAKIAMREAEEVSAGGQNFYQIDTPAPIYFTLLGNRLVAANDKDFLAKALRQAADPEYQGSSLMPSTGWGICDVKVDLAKLRALGGYDGNFISHIIGHAADILATEKYRGGWIEWGLDSFVLGRALHIDVHDQLEAGIHLTSKGVELQIKLQPRNQADIDSYAASLLNIPASTPDITRYLPRETMFFSRAQCDFNVLLNDLKQETIRYTSSGGSSPEQREELANRARREWDDNIMRINRTLRTKTLEKDIGPNLGPEYGFAAIWTGVPPTLPGDATVLPGLVYFTRIGQPIRDKIDKYIADSIDIVFRNIDHKRLEDYQARHQPGGKSFKYSWKGIDTQPYKNYELKKLGLDTTALDLGLYYGLDINIQPGYMLIDDYLFFSSNLSALELIAETSAKGGDSLASVWASQNYLSEDCNQEGFMQFQPVSEHYRANLGSFLMENQVDNAAYPECKTDLSKLYKLKGPHLRLFSTDYYLNLFDNISSQTNLGPQQATLKIAFKLAD
ncbi:hypothetical protein ACFL54_04600 [Planctomycetota bacterium]